MPSRTGGHPAEQDSDVHADEVRSTPSFRLPASWTASRASLAEVGACLVDAVPSAEFAAVVILTTERSTKRAPRERLLAGAGIVGTTPAAAAMLEMEGQLGEGPITTACHSQSIVIAGSVGSNQGWRRFGPAMADCHLHSVLCAPMVSTTGATAGVLAVYSRQQTPFDASAIVLIAALAEVVTHILSSTQTLETTATAFAALRATHQRTRIVDQAVGVLISQHRCTEEQARARLASMASQGHQELSVSAHMIVDDARREAPRIHRSRPE